MADVFRPLALVTGASTGIGYELAKRCAQSGYDLVIAADEPKIAETADELRSFGVNVNAVQADLSTAEGVNMLWNAFGALSRPIDILCANAGRGLGHGFLDEDFDAAKHVVETNITGTLDLVQRVGREMRRQGYGRILIVGSIAGFMPGTFQAVYNGTKAFLDSFSYALRAELEDTGVTVTCLMPGATETAFFGRAGMLDTRVGQAKKDDPAEVARIGFEAMMRGEAGIVSGWKNKIMSAIASVLPSTITAEQHRKMAEPRGGHDRSHPPQP